MAERFARLVQRQLMTPALRALAVLLGSLATPALAQTPTTLTVNGTLVIDGGGTNAYTEKYSSITVTGGTDTRTIRLSPEHKTLVIRGNALFGGSCSTGADCFNTDICDAEAKVCGWSGIELALPQCGNATQLAELDRTFDDCVKLWRLDNPTDLVARANACMQAGRRLYGAGAVVSADCPQLQQYRDGYDLVFSTGPGWEGNILNKAIRKGVIVSLADSEGGGAHWPDEGGPRRHRLLVPDPGGPLGHGERRPAFRGHQRRHRALLQEGLRRRDDRLAAPRRRFRRFAHRRQDPA
jgi:hypothetical protein